MSSNRIAYSDTGASLKDEPHYRLAKGRSSKPNAIGTCDLFKANDGEGHGIGNRYVLRDMKPVARVQSRHRVSPSPRKIPNYEIDIMVEAALGKLALNLNTPLAMVHNFRNNIRMNIPRYR